MESHLSLRRRLLPFGFAAEYNLLGNLPPYHMPDLVDSVMRTLLQPEWLEQGQLDDVKGRDALNLIQSNIPERDKPHRDELFWISGELYTGDINDPTALASEQITTFEVRAHTIFKEFVGAHHIAHSLQLARQGELPEQIPLQYIGRIFPARIRDFRFGLDFFESKYLSAMLGFAPTATQSLLIESSEKTFQLRIIAECLKSRDILPLEKYETFSKLSMLCEKFFGLNLMKDYRVKAGMQKS